VAADPLARAQLVAIDGARGRDIERKARNLRRKTRRISQRHAAISRWDASGAFYELRAAGKKSLTLPPRTLLLVYAADLAFRLRWEIQPALEAGHSVIAAPYVETAIAFGEAAGLTRRWVAELLRFAPRADVQVRAGKENRRTSARTRAMDGFLEFAAAAAKTLRQRTPAQPSKDRSASPPRTARRVRARGRTA